MCTIKANDVIAGSIAKFVMENEAGITYWIDRQFWGQGIATTALKNFLKTEQTRPIYGRVAFDNYGSQKVLEKCGFVKSVRIKDLPMPGKQKLKNIFTNFRHNKGITANCRYKIV